MSLSSSERNISQLFRFKILHFWRTHWDLLFQQKCINMHPRVALDVPGETKERLMASLFFYAPTSLFPVPFTRFYRKPRVPRQYSISSTLCTIPARKWSTLQTRAFDRPETNYLNRDSFVRMIPRAASVFKVLFRRNAGPVNTAALCDSRPRWVYPVRL